MPLVNNCSSKPFVIWWHYFQIYCKYSYLKKSFFAGLLIWSLKYTKFFYSAKQGAFKNKKNRENSLFVSWSQTGPVLLRFNSVRKFSSCEICALQFLLNQEQAVLSMFPTWQTCGGNSHNLDDDIYLPYYMFWYMCINIYSMNCSDICA
jgi:hypothetical protein